MVWLSYNADLRESYEDCITKRKGYKKALSQQMMRLDIQLTETLERIDSVYDKVINRYEWCSIFLDQVWSNFSCIGFAPTCLIISRGSNSNEGKMYHTWSIIASVPVGYHCSIFSQQVNHKAAYASCVNNAATRFTMFTLWGFDNLGRLH